MSSTTTYTIPDKILVGFQKRDDTYTKKLAYITYKDNDQIKKEASWRGWCDKSMGAVEIENKPQSGFVLNKGVQRCASMGTGRSLMRIYHPENFEFEISIDNLVEILMISDISKRDIQDECVIAFQGQKLVLLSVNSQEYKTAFNIEQKKNSAQVASVKKLTPGKIVMHKKGAEFVYIGPHNYWSMIWSHTNNISTLSHQEKSKEHIFYDKQKQDFCTLKLGSNYIVLEEMENYQELINQYNTSTYAGKICKLEVVSLPDALKINMPRLQRENINKMLTNDFTHMMLHKISENKLSTFTATSNQASLCGQAEVIYNADKEKSFNVKMKNNWVFSPEDLPSSFVAVDSSSLVKSLWKSQNIGILIGENIRGEKMVVSLTG